MTEQEKEVKEEMTEKFKTVMLDRLNKISEEMKWVKDTLKKY